MNSQILYGKQKENKYRKEVARLRNKTHRIFISDKKAQKFENKAIKLESKADVIKTKIDSTIAKLQKNNIQRNTYNKGLETVNRYLKKYK